MSKDNSLDSPETSSESWENFPTISQASNPKGPARCQLVEKTLFLMNKYKSGGGCGNKRPC